MASIWRGNMLGYLSLEIISSSKLTVFREHSSRQTVSFEEHIIFNDPTIFLLLYCVYSVLQIFFLKRAVLKIGEYHTDIQSCDAFNRTQAKIFDGLQHSDVPQFLMGKIQLRDAFRPIALEQKSFMDYNLGKFGFVDT